MEVKGKIRTGSKGRVSIRFSGKLFSGLAQGAQFTQLEWVQKQWKTKLGFIPHPGTFNLKLAHEYLSLARELKERKVSIEIEPPSSDFCRAKCYRVSVGGVKGAIVIPIVYSYPDDIIEILAPRNLRQALSVADGDDVWVTLDE
jgi:riboflavin kinase, archaea type